MFAKTLLVGACALLASAQQMSKSLTFTNVPVPVIAGNSVPLQYLTNDASTAATIVLRKGLSSDLKTIATLTTTSIGGKFIWTPSTSLVSGSDYALQITQGANTNYYGPFTIESGVKAGPSVEFPADPSYPSSYASSAPPPSGQAVTPPVNNSSSSSTTPIPGYTPTTGSTTTTNSAYTPHGNFSATTPRPGGNNTGPTVPYSASAASSLSAVGSSLVSLAVGAVAVVFFY